MYWNKEVTYTILSIIRRLRSKKNSTFKVVATALMGIMAVLFQSAGGIVPGVGLLISPFATLPIIIGIFIGVSYGLLSYMLTILLLLFIQPSELLIFPFTTGLLAIGIGLSFMFFKKRWEIIIISGVFLTTGICILLYGVHFPVLGPFLLDFKFWNLIFIYLFSLLYSWIWVELILKFLPRIFK